MKVSCGGALDDGVMLFNLVAIMSGKEIGNINVSKTFAHKINNLSTTFMFLKSEGVKMIGIGPEGMLRRKTGGPGLGGS